MNLLKKLFPFLFKEEKKEIEINEIIDYSEAQDQLFHTIQPYSVIYATMPLSDEELAKIEDGHRVRPYIVVKKEDKALYCYQTSSSNNYRWLKTSHKYLLKENQTNIKKDSMVDLSNVYKIERKHLIRYFYTLEESEIQQIQKRLLLHPELEAFENIEVALSCGDVILYQDKKYYINKIDEKLECYPLDDKGIAFAFDEQLYFINGKAKVEIPLASYHIVAFVDPHQAKQIAEQINKNSFEVTVGALIQYDKRTAYYIEEEKEDYYLVFFTDFYDVHSKDGTTATNKNSTYFMHFKPVSIPKEDYEIITVFDSEQQDKISTAYHKYLVKQSTVPTYSTEYPIGQVFEKEDETFIYLFSYKQKHYGTSFENLDEQDFKLFYLTDLKDYTAAEIMEEDQLSSLLLDLADENKNELKNILLDQEKQFTKA